MKFIGKPIKNYFPFCENTQFEKWDPRNNMTKKNIFWGLTDFNSILIIDDIHLSRWTQWLFSQITITMKKKILFLSIKIKGRFSISGPSGLPQHLMNYWGKWILDRQLLGFSLLSTEWSSHRSAAAGQAGIRAGLGEGCEVDGLQAWGGQAGVEQETGGHTGLRNVAGWGAVVTAGWLQ